MQPGVADLTTAAPSAMRAGIHRLAKRAPAKLERILLTRVQYLGDCVVFLPTVTAVRRSLPDAEIHVLAGTGPGEAVFRMCPDVDRIVRTSWGVARSSGDTFSEIRMLRDGRYDAVLLSTEETGASLKMLLAGIPFAAGFSRIEHMGETHVERFPWLLSRVMQQHAGMHEVEVNLQLCDAIGADSSLGSFNILPGDSAEADARRIASSYGLRPAQFACVHVGAKRGKKLWDSEAFASVCDRLSGAGITPAFVGTEGERETVASVRARMQESSVDLAGQTSVASLAALMKLAAVFLGNDSGPMHLAAAVGAPVVSVFVASDPAQWGPWLPPEKGRVFRLEDASPDVVSLAALDLARRDHL